MTRKLKIALKGAVVKKAKEYARQTFSIIPKVSGIGKVKKTKDKDILADALIGKYL